jgi:hypothetical protein
MSEPPDLLQQQQALKGALAGGEYRSLAEVILDGTGRLIQKVTRAAGPPPFWYNALAFTLLTLLVCALAGLLLGGAMPGLGLIARLNLLLAGILGIAIGSAFLIASAAMHRRLMATMAGSLVGEIETPSALQDLDAWLKSTFDLKRQFWISALPALILLPGANILLSLATGIRFDLSVYLCAIIAGFQAFTALTIVLACLTLPHRLSHYPLKLFGADPRSSQTIEDLARTLNSVLLTGSVILALFTLDVVLFIPASIVAYVILPLPWLLLISIFISNQSALAKIIQRAKRKTLNEIQAQIETLQRKEAILSEDTLKHINQLLDYHQRIRSSHNSAVDIQSGLNLLQSLLLPVIGLLLANLTDILDLFSRLLAVLNK